MNLHEPLIAPQPTPNVDELAAALAAYRDANREARAQLAAVTAERDALRAAAQAALAFWSAPRPTFGCNESRKAELATVQAALRAALNQ